MNKQLFFCFGPPKSGTTFLQRTLNLHPEISCPAEHQFDFLINNFSSLLKQYEKILELVDHRTGGQGITPMKQNIHRKLFTYTVQNMVWESANGKNIAGANDNTIIRNIDLYDDLFNSPKFIAIFRNPIDTAISAWHHNMKLAKEENNEQHKLLMTKHGGLEDWIKVIAKNFTNHVQACTNFSRNRENIIIIRYEDLIENKKENLMRMFDFLGASTDKQTLNKIIKESSFTFMRKTSTRKDFFRSGQTNMGKSKISSALRKEISTIASVGLAALGYDLAE